MKSKLIILNLNKIALLTFVVFILLNSNSTVNMYNLKQVQTISNNIHSSFNTKSHKGKDIEISADRLTNKQTNTSYSNSDTKEEIENNNIINLLARKSNDIRISNESLEVLKQILENPKQGKKIIIVDEDQKSINNNYYNKNITSIINTSKEKELYSPEELNNIERVVNKTLIDKGFNITEYYNVKYKKLNESKINDSRNKNTDFLKHINNNTEIKDYNEDSDKKYYYLPSHGRDYSLTQNHYLNNNNFITAVKDIILESSIEKEYNINENIFNPNHNNIEVVKTYDSVSSDNSIDSNKSNNNDLSSSLFPDKTNQLNLAKNRNIKLLSLNKLKIIDQLKNLNSLLIKKNYNTLINTLISKLGINSINNSNSKLDNFLNLKDYSNSNLSAALYSTIMSNINLSVEKDQFIQIYFSLFNNFQQQSHHNINLLSFLNSSIKEYFKLRSFIKNNFNKKINSLYESSDFSLKKVGVIYDNYNKALFDISKSTAINILKEISYLETEINEYVVSKKHKYGRKENDFIENNIKDSGFKNVLNVIDKDINGDIDDSLINFSLIDYLVKYLQEFKSNNNNYENTYENIGKNKEFHEVYNLYNDNESKESVSTNNDRNYKQEINNFKNDDLLVKKVIQAMESLCKEFIRIEKNYSHLVVLLKSNYSFSSKRLDRNNSNNKNNDRLSSIYNIFYKEKESKNYNIEEIDDILNSRDNNTNNNSEDYLINLIGRKNVLKVNEKIVSKIGNILGDLMCFLKESLIGKLKLEHYE